MTTAPWSFLLNGAKAGLVGSVLSPVDIMRTGREYNAGPKVDDEGGPELTCGLLCQDLEPAFAAKAKAEALLL